jgi:hypothetical protein
METDVEPELGPGKKDRVGGHGEAFVGSKFIPNLQSDRGRLSSRRVCRYDLAVTLLQRLPCRHRLCIDRFPLRAMKRQWAMRLLVIGTVSHVGSF